MPSSAPVPAASIEIVIRLKFDGYEPTEHPVSAGVVEPGTTMGELMASVAAGLRDVADDIEQQSQEHTATEDSNE